MYHDDDPYGIKEFEMRQEVIDAITEKMDEIMDELRERARDISYSQAIIYHEAIKIKDSLEGVDRLLQSLPRAVEVAASKWQEPSRQAQTLASSRREKSMRLRGRT